MTDQITKDLGGITAYAAAVAAGYTGTKAQFETLMASYATVAESAAESASDAASSATAAASHTAPAYDATKTYKVGEYVVYSSQLYRCITAITTAEAWTAGHWTQTAVATDVSVLKEDINNIEDAFTKELTLVSKVVGRYIDSQGVQVSSTHDTLYTVKVEPNTDIVLTRVCVGGYRCVVAFDSNMSNPQDITPYHNWSEHTFDLTTGNNVAYVSFVWNDEISTVPPTYENKTKFTNLGWLVHDTLFEETDEHIIAYQECLKNDLLSEGVPVNNILKCYKNGSASDSNYGQDGTIYQIKKTLGKRFRVFFEWQLSSQIPMDRTAYISLMSIGATMVRPIVYVRNMLASGNYIYRDSLIGFNNAVIGGSSIGFTDTPFNGTPSFYVQYTGNAATMTMTISNSAVSFSNGQSVSYSSSDSVDTLVEAINSLSDFTCVGTCTVGHTCSELCYNASVNIELVRSFTNSESQTITDRPRIYIPYAWDKKWHSLECVVDMDANKSYLAIDGLTIVSNVTDTRELDGEIIIGSDVLNESYVNVKNLEIDFNGWGDAEIVQSVAPPYNGLTQLISNHNPRLLIYEGHGVDIGADKDMPVTDNMAVSTDRLEYIFSVLQAKGYAPVTWEQIIDWKINNIALPKRCFTIMFDDYRFENFVDYQKRIPFNKYNVKAGLAVISDAHPLTDVVHINGTDYTIAQMIDVVNKAGWYPCSHTKDHRRISDYSDEELHDLLKADVVSCDLHGLHSDIVVYPYGGFVVERDKSALENSAFKLGVNIVINKYNCRASNDMNLARVEIGTRETLENVLAPIV